MAPCRCVDLVAPGSALAASRGHRQYAGPAVAPLRRRARSGTAVAAPEHMAEATGEGELRAKPRGRRPAPPRPGQGAEGEALAARLHEIGTTVGPVDVLEPALRAIVEAMGA